MKILMVTSYLPYPRAMSGAVVMYGQLAALAARHELTLATFASADSVERNAIEQLKVSGINVHHICRSRPVGSELLSLEVWRRRLQKAHGWLCDSYPLRTLKFYQPRMQHLIDRLLSEEQFDLLQVEDNAMGSYQFRTQIPSVLTEHDVRLNSQVYRLAPLRSGRIKRILSEADQCRWQQYQKNVWRRFDRIQVFTTRDAEAIQKISPEIIDRVRVNPFGVEIPKEADPSNEEAGTIVFVGGFGHPPNVNAALWLGYKIMPLLRSLWPGIRLTIVGRNPTKEVRALASDDIIVTGWVPAVEPFLERAAVVIAPLRTGGGMRIKVLQAMALGKAVVTTPLGAAGLTFANNQAPLIIAENAEGIARATVKLLAKDDARRTLGRRARAFVTEHHSWSAYGQRLEAIYSELKSKRVG
jgi:glycosyltransferase involved in cell wall biosynthesis